MGISVDALVNVSPELLQLDSEMNVRYFESGAGGTTHQFFSKTTELSKRSAAKFTVIFRIPPKAGFE